VTNGVCPKCQSQDVYRGRANDGEGLNADGDQLFIELVRDGVSVQFVVDTLICRACGYIEMHVANRDELRALGQAEGWEKIN
jgi:hypothetical protein